MNKSDRVWDMLAPKYDRATSRFNLVIEMIGKVIGRRSLQFPSGNAGAVIPAEAELTFSLFPARDSCLLKL